MSNKWYPALSFPKYLTASTTTISIQRKDTISVHENEPHLRRQEHPSVIFQKRMDLSYGTHHHSLDCCELTSRATSWLRIRAGPMPLCFPKNQHKNWHLAVLTGCLSIDFPLFSILWTPSYYITDRAVPG